MVYYTSLREKGIPSLEPSQQNQSKHVHDPNTSSNNLD